MPADPITPGLAAAWTFLSPAAYGVPSRFTAAVRGQSNVTTSATLTATFDGVSLQGTEATAKDRAILLTAQSNAAQNGIYITNGGGASVTLSLSFSPSGNAQKTGLTAGRLYYWYKSNGYTVSNGSFTLTESGFIVASPSGTLDFTGPASTGVNDWLIEANLARYSLFDAPNEFPVELVINVAGGTSANTWWQLVSVVTTIGTSPVTFTQITVGSLDVGTEDNPFDNLPPGSRTPNNAAAFQDTLPEQTTAPLLDAPVAMTGTPPVARPPANATAFDDTPASALVLQGEKSPVAGITTPASPTAVNHTATLTAGINYLVQVGARLAPVSITLPDPGSLAQRIEIADITGQAATFGITVNAGTKDIETAGQTTYTIDRNDAVLVLSYTGTKWKIL